MLVYMNMSIFMCVCVLARMRACVSVFMRMNEY